MSRFSVVALLAVLVIAAGPDRKEVKKLVGEYLDSPTPARQEEIEKRLRQAKPKLLVSPLKSALKKEDRRATALQLIRATRPSGLYKTISRHVDSPLEEDVIRTLLSIEDKGSHRFVCDRWKKASEDSESMAILNRALGEIPVSAPEVALFRTYLDEQGARGEAARDILGFQLLLDEEQLASLNQNWDSVFKGFLLVNQRFKHDGTDLLRQRRDEWAFGYGDKSETELCSWIRNRVKIATGGVLRLGDLNMTSVHLIVRVLTRETTGCAVGVHCAGQAFVGVNLVKDKWMGHFEGQDPGTTPASDEEWTTVEIKVDGKKASTSVNGVPVGRTERGGTCEELSIRGGSTGELWVGSVDLVTR